MPSDHAIRDMTQRATVAAWESRSSDYLRGVCAALDWVSGEDDEPPLCAAGPAKFPSIVVGLLKTVYDNHPQRSRYRGGAKSFRRLNSGLRTVLAAAIETSLPFALEDFYDVFTRFGGCYWFGESRGEGFYRIAVEGNHLSACRSFEHWKMRKPFMWQGKRLACSSAFRWDGQDVTVTSIADDGLSLTACSYTGKSPRKVKRRYSITHKQLRAANRESNG
jgi:hypothetical protein